MKKFKRVYIEITNICNLKCSFCPTSKRKKDFMSVEKFEKVLEKISDITNYVYLHVKGEPLLHPNILLFLDKCNEKKLQVNLITNGTLINQVHDELLKKKAIRQISFSLQSFENKECKEEAIKYMKDIMTFIKEAVSKTNIFLELRLWNLNNENNGNQNNELNRLKLDIIQRSLGLPYNIEEKKINNKGIKLIDKVYMSQNYQFNWPEMSRDVISSVGSCYGLTQQIAILVDGTIVPCCLDQEGDIILGNIFKDEIKEIMEKDRVQNIVKGFKENRLVEPLCRKCGYRQRIN